MQIIKKQLLCKLTSPELQQHKNTIIAELKTLLVSRRELDNGYAYEFRATNELLDKLNVFIKTERLCCDFFIFRLTIKTEKILLEVTGPDGVKMFLSEEINL
jgi:hypothetical protein